MNNEVDARQILSDWSINEFLAELDADVIKKIKDGTLVWNVTNLRDSNGNLTMSKSMLEIARAEAERLKEEQRKKIAAEQSERERENNLIASLKKQVNDCLDEFNGVNGIERKGKSLYKGYSLIASMSVEWEEWENPNYDYRVTERGYVTRWEIYRYAGEEVESTGTSLESFARAMAKHI
jgi:hypothetical protein